MSSSRSFLIQGFSFWHLKFELGDPLLTASTFLYNVADLTSRPQACKFSPRCCNCHQAGTHMTDLVLASRLTGLHPNVATGVKQVMSRPTLPLRLQAGKSSPKSCIFPHVDTLLISHAYCCSTSCAIWLTVPPSKQCGQFGSGLQALPAESHNF